MANKDEINKQFAQRGKVIKWLMDHRSRVSSKLAIVASDLIMRGRRHDNSYTSETEVDLFIKAREGDQQEYHKELLSRVHENLNDYCFRYYSNGLLGMNLVQLFEYICDKMSRLEEERGIKLGEKSNITKEDYINAVTAEFGELSEGFAALISNTVEYIMDANKYTKAILERKDMEIADYVKTKEG